MKIKLTEEKLRYIALFEELTSITPKDCVESGNEKHLTYVVNKDQMGKAIGQNGRNIQKVRDELDKKVYVVEYSEDPEEFLQSIFSPVEIESIEFEENDEGEERIFVKVDESEKGRAVGKKGWNIERARKLLDRHHGYSDVKLRRTF